MIFTFPNKPVRIYDVNSIAKVIDLEQWLVQPKWNGHRALASCDVKGKVTVFNRQGTPLALAANNFTWLGMLEIPKPWALDGELLRNGKMIVWDFSVLDGNLRIKEPYQDRLKELQALISRKLSKDKFSIETIETMQGKNYRRLMLQRSDKDLEGFVFKLPTATDMWGPFRTTENASQFKYRF